jgi:hypothetical protein
LEGSSGLGTSISPVPTSTAEIPPFTPLMSFETRKRSFYISVRDRPMGGPSPHVVACSFTVGKGASSAVFPFLYLSIRMHYLVALLSSTVTYAYCVLRIVGCPSLFHYHILFGPPLILHDLVPRLEHVPGIETPPKRPLGGKRTNTDTLSTWRPERRWRWGCCPHMIQRDAQSLTGPSQGTGWTGTGKGEKPALEIGIFQRSAHCCVEKPTTPTPQPCCLLQI